MPQFFNAFFNTASARAFALARDIVRRPLILAGFVTVSNGSFTQLHQRVATRRLTRFAFTGRTGTNEIFFLHNSRAGVFDGLARLQFFRFTSQRRTLHGLLVTRHVGRMTLIFVTIRAARRTTLTVSVNPACMVANDSVVNAWVFNNGFRRNFGFSLFITRGVQVQHTANFVFNGRRFRSIIPMLNDGIGNIRFGTRLITSDLNVDRVHYHYTVFLAIIFFPILRGRTFGLVSLLLRRPNEGKKVSATKRTSSCFFYNFER